jgi:hypothetical protein
VATADGSRGAGAPRLDFVPWPNPRRSPETLRTLFDAFAALDGDAMAVCYARDATFEDPVFRLSRGDVGDMRRMLTESGRDRAGPSSADPADRG